MDPKILVVDDEQMIREMLEQAFTKNGFAVTTAGTAEEALEILGQKSIFVMFIDLNLPGMNGIELCAQIKNQHPMAIPIAFTGHSSLFELTDCRTAGFEDYFIKPAKISDLIDAAENAFGKLKRWRQG